MNLKFTWKKKTRQYQQGASVYLNRIRVGSFDWNSGRSRDESETDDSSRWVGYIELPSLTDKSKRVYGVTPEEIKPKIERVVTSWFTEALKEKPDNE